MSNIKFLVIKKDFVFLLIISISFRFCASGPYLKGGPHFVELDPCPSKVTQEGAKKAEVD